MTGQKFSSSPLVYMLELHHGKYLMSHLSYRVAGGCKSWKEKEERKIIRRVDI